jgi:hypothetical protein
VKWIKLRFYNPEEKSMAIDWNADVGELFKQLLSPKPKGPIVDGGAPEERVGVAALWPLLLLLLVGSNLGLLYWPTQQEISHMQRKVDHIPKLELNQIELQVMNKRNREATTIATTEVEQLHQMMFAHREIDQLYRQIHEWARVNQIEILTLKKLGVEPVTAQDMVKKGRGGGEQKADPLFYKIRLMLRSRGEFLDYLKLRKALLGLGKMIHVDGEKIRALRLESSASGEQERYQQEGKVVVEMELSAYQSDRQRDVKEIGKQNATITSRP